MILKGECDREAVVRSIGNLGGRSVGVLSRSQIRTEEEFTLADHLKVTYAEDVAASCRFLQVHGDFEDRVTSTVTALEDTLAPWSYSDLLRFFDIHDDEEHQISATLRLAVGAPPAFDQDFFTRIEDSLRSENLRVRKSALSAISYYSVKEFSPLLRTVAESDPAPSLRETAQIILDIYEERGLR